MEEGIFDLDQLEVRDGLHMGGLCHGAHGLRMGGWGTQAVLRLYSGV